MRRVTVERFVKAVKETGVIPRRCLWVRPKGETFEACGIGTLAVAAGKKTTTDAIAYAKKAEGLGLSAEYVSGYITGFDGRNKPTSWQGEKEVGWEDGRACAEAVFDQELHKKYSFGDVDMSPYMDTPWGDEEENYNYVYNYD